MTISITTHRSASYPPPPNSNHIHYSLFSKKIIKPFYICFQKQNKTTTKKKTLVFLFNKNSMGESSSQHESLKRKLDSDNQQQKQKQDTMNSVTMATSTGKRRRSRFSDVPVPSLDGKQDNGEDGGEGKDQGKQHGVDTGTSNVTLDERIRNDFSAEEAMKKAADIQYRLNEKLAKFNSTTGPGVGAASGMAARPTQLQAGLASAQAAGANVAPKGTSERLAELQARIQAKLKSQGSATPLPPSAFTPSPSTASNIMNSSKAAPDYRDAVAAAAKRAALLASGGARITGTGSVPAGVDASTVNLDTFKTPLNFSSVPIKPVSTLKINQNVAREQILQKILKIDKADLIETNPAKNPYYDARMKPIEASRHRRREMKFAPEGKYVQIAEKERERLEIERIKAEMRAKEAEIAKSAKSSVEPMIVALLKEEDPHAKHIPDVEWWDTPFLVNNTYADIENSPEPLIHLNRVTHYIHHPKAVKPAKPEEGPVTIPLMLTEREKKKLRHHKRMEKEKERQSMVQMGLIPPPPPKVKLSNMMRVLANEASQDPTKVEAQVRAQVEKRRKDHELQNEARKLSKEERQAKIENKFKVEREKQLHVAVFRVLSMSNGQHRYKVTVNAQQLYLTGCLLIYSQCNAIVVEGAEKAIKKFKKLMLHRIDWNSKVMDENQSPHEGDLDDVDRMESDDVGAVKKAGNGQVQDNKCVLVWEGVVGKSSFSEFKPVTIPTADGVRSYFNKRRIGHYWDMALAAPIQDL